MKTNNSFKEVLLYLIVGIISTLTEWSFFYVCEDVLLIHYTIATVLAYVVSTFVNWVAGRILVFAKSNKPVLVELSQIYLASIFGLLLNLLIMFVCVDIISFGEMISKIIATGIVFFFSFFIRKFYIYK